MRTPLHVLIAMPMRNIILLVSLLVVSEGASAGKMLDYIRNHDLNDFALGVAVSSSQNPYAGADNSLFAYPYLTSFTDSAFTEDWILIRDGSLGFRWVTENQWELGALGRVETRGFGGSQSDTLIGVADRQWTLEVGPTIGWRGWPVQVNLNTFAEISGRHNGVTSELNFSYPLGWSRGFFVPSVELIYQSSAYTAYYFAVDSLEALPDRPEYFPGAAMNVALKARWGYALSDTWLLTGSFGVEFLDSVIIDSPIVDRDRILSANIGVAYNVDLFRARYYDGSAPRSPNVEFRLGVFQDSVSSKVVKNTSDGVPGFEVDVEDILGPTDNETVLQFDAIVRIGNFHRLEFGYFELGRNSETILIRDIEFGDELFPAGTLTSTKIDMQIFRAGYAYSLIRDAQKELGVMIGVHFMKFTADVSTTATGQEVQSKVSTPLPVIGLHGSIFLSEKWSVNAKVQVFGTEFDNYEGSLNYATLDVQYGVSESVRVGLGYNYYGMSLSSRNNELNGHFQMQHHGPSVFVSVGF